MQNRTSVFVDADDRVRREALSDLLAQNDEFETLDALDDARPPSVILLDANVERRRSALLRCRCHRARFQYCSLILLAGNRSNAEDIEEFEASADSVMREPFSIRDLISSMRLQVRNRRWLASESVRIGGLTFFPVERRVKNDDGAEVILSVLEARLLQHLHLVSGKSVSRGLLLKEVWGYEPNVDTTTVQTHVHRIRFKLRELDREADFIVTKGDSYGLKADDSAK